MAVDVSKYIAEKKILILDHMRASRTIVQNAFLQLGANPKNIFALKSYQHAKETIGIEKPEIIVTEFQIHDDFGLNLLQYQAEYIPDPFDRLLVVVTENGQQSAVADAAEEDVDAFILKPFDEKMVTQYVYRSIQNKLNPSEYAQAIKRAKVLIEEKKAEEAKNVIALAKFLVQKPCLAFYYSGQASELMGEDEIALSEYREGLKLNPIHFKCLVGQFMVLNKQKKEAEAYKALSELSMKFPLTPELLKQAFLLSIFTYNYQEVDRYYKAYIELPRKTDDLKRVVSAALLTAGKLLLKDREVKQSLDYFHKGSVIRGRESSYLNNIINTLMREGLHNECKLFLSMFQSEELASDVLLQLKFKVAAKDQRPDMLIKEGKELIFSGLGDEMIYELVLKACKIAGQMDLAENIAYKAVEQYPQDRAKYVAYFRK